MPHAKEEGRGETPKVTSHNAQQSVGTVFLKKETSKLQEPWLATLADIASWKVSLFCTTSPPFNILPQKYQMSVTGSIFIMLIVCWIIDHMPFFFCLHHYFLKNIWWGNDNTSSPENSQDSFCAYGKEGLWDNFIRTMVVGNSLLEIPSLSFKFNYSWIKECPSSHHSFVHWALHLNRICIWCANSDHGVLT